MSARMGSRLPAPPFALPEIEPIIWRLTHPDTGTIFPPEILTRIFWWSLGSFTDPKLHNAGQHAASRHAILQSSGGWRTAALGDPSLWTDLFVDNAGYSNMDRFCTFVRRTGRLSIHLAIALYDDQLGQRTFVPVADFLATLFGVPDFLRAAEQCTELTILSTHLGPTVQLLSMISHDTFPVLHCLNMDIPDLRDRRQRQQHEERYGQHYVDLTTVQQQLLQFVEVKIGPGLKMWRMARSFIPCSPQTLTVLRLEFLPSHFHVTWSDLSAVLESPPSLTRLYLRNVVFEGDTGSDDRQMRKLRCCLPRVTHFSLVIHRARNGTLRVITALQLPALDTFECSVPYAGWMMLASSSPSILESVGVAIFTLKPDCIRRLLPVLKRVRLLDLRKSEGISVLDNIQQALADARKTSLCPALRRLLVSDQSTLHQINRILQRRSAGQFSLDFALVCPYPTMALSGIGRHILHQFRRLDDNLDQHAVSIGNCFEETQLLFAGEVSS
ncbi:hypothetical protein B0H13DRAFT_1849542 [Mycena leptocephala]|nr:hypothetical protein B0H13DRAFT_1849542 [Mycena leptocephala]